MNFEIQAHKVIGERPAFLDAFVQRPIFTFVLLVGVHVIHIYSYVSAKDRSVNILLCSFRPSDVNLVNVLTLLHFTRRLGKSRGIILFSIIFEVSIALASRVEHFSRLFVYFFADMRIP